MLIKDTTRKDMAVPEEELMPGDHWIHRDLTPVIRTVRQKEQVDPIPMPTPMLKAPLYYFINC